MPRPADPKDQRRCATPEPWISSVASQNSALRRDCHGNAAFKAPRLECQCGASDSEQCYLRRCLPRSTSGRLSVPCGGSWLWGSVAWPRSEPARTLGLPRLSAAAANSANSANFRLRGRGRQRAPACPWRPRSGRAASPAPLPMAAVLTPRACKDSLNLPLLEVCTFLRFTDART